MIKVSNEKYVQIVNFKTQIFVIFLQRKARTVVSRTYENCTAGNSLVKLRRVKALVSHAVRGCCGPAGTTVSVCGILCLARLFPFAQPRTFALFLPINQIPGKLGSVSTAVKGVLFLDPNQW